MSTPEAAADDLYTALGVRIRGYLANQNASQNSSCVVYQRALSEAMPSHSFWTPIGKNESVQSASSPRYRLYAIFFRSDAPSIAE